MSKKVILFLLMALFYFDLYATSELQIKAVFLKKFTHLIEWPADNKADFNICVINDKGFSNELKNIYAHQTFKEKTVSIIDLLEDMPIPDCQLLFIGKHTQNIQKTMRSISKRSILTVSDNQDFVKDDVIITMFLNKNRFRYIINNKTAKNAGIQISYLLLKSAQEVIK